MKTKRSQLQMRRRPAARTRADDELGEGIVEAYVSVYDVEYRIGPFGDRELIEKGAFAGSIEDKPVIPHFWSHNWPAGLMVGDSAPTSDDHGVKTMVTLDMDDELGRRVWRRHKSGAIDEFSIGYMPTVLRFDPDDDELERVVEAQLIESSSVVLGANPETELIDVRARSLVTPVFSVGENGALEVQWASVSKPAEQPPAPSDDGTQQQVTITGSDSTLTLNINVTTSGAEASPATPIDATKAHELLREPKFREVVRERLSSGV